MYAIERIEINLIVPSIEKTIEWYEKILNWTGHKDVFDEKGNCTFGSVMKDKVGMNLIKSVNNVKCKVPNFIIFIRVDDVDVVYDTVVQNGYKTYDKPKNTFWVGKVFQLIDLNGYCLQFVEITEDIEIEEIRERYKEISN